MNSIFRNMGDSEADTIDVSQPTAVAERVKSLENIGKSVNSSTTTDTIGEKTKSKRGRKKKSDTVLSDRIVFEYF